MADATRPHRPSQAGLQQLPKEVLLKILRLVDKEDWRDHDQLSGSSDAPGPCHLATCCLYDTAGKIQGGTPLQRGVTGTSTILALRGLSRGLRASVDEAMRHFTFSINSELGPSEREQHSLWWGFYLRDVMPRWRNLTSVELLFDWNASHLTLVLRALRQACPGLEMLSLEYRKVGNTPAHGDLSYGLQIGVLAPLQNLTTVELRGFTASYESWSAELVQLSSLRNLTLERCTLERLAPPMGLTRLWVNGARHKTHQEVELVLPTDLEELHLSHTTCSSISLTNHTRLCKLNLCSVGHEGFSAGPFPNLECVSLDKMRLASLEWLEPCVRVTAVHIHDIRGLRDLPATSHMSRLQHLCLSMPRGPHDPLDLRHLSSLQSLAVYNIELSRELLVPWLCSLHVLGPFFGAMEVTQLHLIAGVTSLTQLHLACGNTTIQALPVLTALVGLLSLTIRRLPIVHLEGACIPPSVCNLTLKSMSALSVLGALDSLRSLQHLEISDCPNLNALELNGVQCLQSLNVSDCRVLAEVKLTRLPKLQQALLSDCNILTTLVGLKDLPLLEGLCIRDFPALKSLVLGPGLARLELLELDKCGALEKVSGIATLSRSATLQIKGCNHIQMVM